MKSSKRKSLTYVLALGMMFGGPRLVKADMFGGDIVVLSQILANAVQQLVQLEQILKSGKDSLSLMHEINQGLKNALQIQDQLRPHLDPGSWSELTDVVATMRRVEQLYGLIPRTPESSRQKLLDQSVAEAINLHTEALNYANEIDPVASQIKQHAQVVNPQGAGKLTAQSVGVLVDVTNQVLRTNAAILKVQSEQLAGQNRASKLSSEQFVRQYNEISQGLAGLQPTYDLPQLYR